MSFFPDDFARWREALGDRIAQDRGDHLTARCPAHDDTTPSLTVTRGESGRVLATCHAGCTFIDIRRALGLTPLAREAGGVPDVGGRWRGKPIVARYDYTDDAGVFLFAKVRLEPKDFAVVRDEGGRAIGNLQGVAARPLYRLPRVRRAIAQRERVFVVEGEKDVHTLESLGLVATCNFDGAAKEGQRPKWRQREAMQLLGAHEVVVLPDHDAAGAAHAAAVVESLRALSPAPVVRVVQLPNLLDKGDVTDWVAAGGDKETLLGLADAAGTADPTAAPSPDDGVRTESEHDLSEDQLARTFTSVYGPRLRYCAQFGQWYTHTGAAFTEDRTTRVFDRARHIARQAIAEAGLEIGSSVARKVRTAATAAAMVKFAQADPVHAIEADDLDRDPWLLNTPGGVVDLRTGQLRPSDPSDLATKLTGTALGGEALRWRAFLHEATGGDLALIGFLQRFVGYCLTGVTTEHSLTFISGPGGTGKSSFLKAVQFVLGTYAQTSPITTFTETRHEAHPTELARLRGARLVSANETEEGRRWAEAKIKSLTGGDVIAARFMRQDYFEFRPQFKLLIVGNHKPHFRSPDSAIRRRLHLLPFTHKPDIIDKDLDAKLEAEAGGILAWALEGCLQWQQQGLRPPDAVIEATGDYLDTEDVFGTWLDERTLADASAWSGSTPLFDDWRQWAESRGEFVGSQKRFVGALEERGFVPAKNPAKTQRGFRGIRLRVRLDALLEQAPDHTTVRATYKNGFTGTTTLGEVRERPELFLAVERVAA